MQFSGEFCRCTPRRRVDPARRKHGGGGGYLDAERRAALGAVETGDLAAMIVDESIADAQTKPRALADGFRRIEGVEDQTRLADARAGVGEQNDYVSPFAQRAHGKRAAAYFLQCIHGVIDDVEEDLQQLIRVAADRGNGSTGLQFDADVLAAKIQTPELRRAGDDGIDVDQGTLLAGHLVCKAEQVVHQRLRAPRLVANFFREFARALASRRIVDQQIGIAQDGREWVVDLMRGARGKRDVQTASLRGALPDDFSSVSLVSPVDVSLPLL